MRNPFRRRPRPPQSVRDLNDSEGGLPAEAEKILGSLRDAGVYLIDLPDRPGFGVQVDTGAVEAELHEWSNRALTREITEDEVRAVTLAAYNNIDHWAKNSVIGEPGGSGSFVLFPLDLQTGRIAGLGEASLSSPEVQRVVEADLMPCPDCGETFRDYHEYRDHVVAHQRGDP